MPEEFITPGREGCFTVSVNGWWPTGVEGAVDYSTRAGNVHLYFDVPLIGGNHFLCEPPPGYRCVGEPGSGDHPYFPGPVFRLEFDF
jgi:hypothetical protein